MKKVTVYAPTNTTASTFVYAPTNTKASKLVYVPTNTISSTLVYAPTNTKAATFVNAPTNTIASTLVYAPTNTIASTLVYAPTNTIASTLVYAPTNTIASTLVYAPINTIASTLVYAPTNTIASTLVYAPANTIASTLVYAPANTIASTLVSTDYTDPSYEEPSTCASTTVTPHRCWKHLGNQVTGVSVGPAGVWSVTPTGNIFYRLNTHQDPLGFGAGWQRVGGGLVQLDVGTDVVLGVNRINRIYRRNAITTGRPDGQYWTHLSEGYTWVSVSPGGSVWAVSTAGHLLHYRHSSNAQPVGTAWDVMDTDVQRVDAGQAGVWALKTDGRLFYRHGTYGDNGSTGMDCAQWKATSPLCPWARTWWWWWTLLDTCGSEVV